MSDNVKNLNSEKLTLMTDFGDPQSHIVVYFIQNTSRKFFHLLHAIIIIFCV